MDYICLGTHQLIDSLHKNPFDWNKLPYTKLLWIVAGDQPESLKSVLDQIDGQDDGLVKDLGEGLQLIHIVASKKNSIAVTELLKRGLSPNTCTNNLCTLLHYAAYSGHWTIIEELLLHDADPNCTTIHGWSPLHFAAKSGHVNSMRLLCAYGADINATTVPEKHAMTALHLLCFLGSPGSLDRLKPRDIRQGVRLLA